MPRHHGDTGMAQGVNWIELRNEGGLEQTLCSGCGHSPVDVERQGSAIRRQSVRETAVLWQVAGATFQLRMYYHVVDW